MGLLLFLILRGIFYLVLVATVVVFVAFCVAGFYFVVFVAAAIRAIFHSDRPRGPWRSKVVPQARYSNRR